MTIDRYDGLLQKLGVADWVRDFRRGRYLKNACIGEQMPAEWYTCPPALVPLTEDGSRPAYKGIWMRWFCGDPFRRYVQAGPEDRFLLREIALTDEQFGAWQIVKAIVTRDGVDEEIEVFGAACGHRDLSVFDGHSLLFGDDDRHMHALPAFEERIPAGLGGRPSHGYAITPPRPDTTLAEMAFFEAAGPIRAALSELKDAPPWMRPAAPVAELFDLYLAGGRLREAWLTLNSTGWKVSQARQAALALAEAAGDETFELQMKAWAEFSLDEAEFIPDDRLSDKGNDLHSY